MACLGLLLGHRKLLGLEKLVEKACDLAHQLIHVARNIAYCFMLLTHGFAIASFGAALVARKPSEAWEAYGCLRETTHHNLVTRSLTHAARTHVFQV